MIKYHGDRIWVKIWVFILSILWGLAVALLTAFIVRPFPDGIASILGVIIWFLGYSALEISVERGDPDDGS